MIWHNNELNIQFEHNNTWPKTCTLNDYTIYNINFNLRFYTNHQQLLNIIKPTIGPLKMHE